MSKSKKANKSRDEGNTQSSREECRSWNFTWNNYKKSDIEDLLKWLNKRKGMSYIFQEEIGEETGTPHLQGGFMSKSQIKFETLKSLFPKVRWDRTGSWKGTIIYCSKEETRSGEQWKSNDIKIPEKLIDPLDGKELFEWQKEILEIIKTKPNERTIHWFWSVKGNLGKSSLVKHIYMNNKDCTLIANGKGNDVRNLINNHINVEKNNLKIIIFDVSRTCEEFVSYEVMEQIKNGLLYSGKYEGGICCFNSPHLIVFANFEPKRKALSKDRWHIVQIDENDYK